MSVFRFKQFQVSQSLAAMKVGTDGVLLGAWCSPHNAPGHILDIGTGTGLIALMMAQRFPQAIIDAIEIEPLAFSQAEENIRNAPWADRMQVIYGDFLSDTVQLLPPYDLLVCNPPYFEKGWRVEDPGRKSARDAEIMPHKELLLRAEQLLTPEGSFCLILPVQEGRQMLDIALAAGWHARHITEVFTKPGKPAKRLLLCLTKIPTPARTDTLTIHEPDGIAYTEAYKTLTQDFYLAF